MATRRKPEPVKVPEKRQSTLTKIGALWLSQGKKGNFLSGRIELDAENEIRVIVFKNDFKEKDNQPDYIIYEPQAEEQAQAERQSAERKFQASDDDIPF